MPITYRPLGRTGVKVSPLCLGGMMFSWGADQDETARMIDRALAVGINFIDTANAYDRGRSEAFIGEALKRNGKRQRVVLATKVCVPMDDQDPNMRGTSRRHVIEQCEASLRRLGTDWIDLYQLHRPQPDIPIDETLRALDDLVRSGKVRYLGTSQFSAWELVESLWASKEHGLNRFISEQPPYHLLNRGIERELLPMAQTYGFAVIPYSPLAGGFLTGKYQRGERPTAGRWVHGKAKEWNEAAHVVVDTLRTLAVEKGCTPGQLAIAWCMHQPGITAPIIGPRSLAQMEDNLVALDIVVTATDQERLDQVSPPRSVVAKVDDYGSQPHPLRW